jgi:ankyrin repeat protein
MSNNFENIKETTQSKLIYHMVKASEKGLDNIVKKILDTGISPNSSTSDTKYPLMEAVTNNNLTTIKLLLVRGADPNYMPEQDTVSPLIIACQEGFENIARLLIEYGADINYTCGFENPINNAFSSNNINIVKMLLEHNVNINCTGYFNRTPLLHAFELRKWDLVSQLIDMGADVNVYVDGGYSITPLYEACLFGNLKLVIKIVEAGADVNFSVDNHVTPICIGTIHGFTHIVEYLLEHGSHFTKIETCNYIPAHLAIRYGHLEILKMFEKYYQQVQFSAILNKNDDNEDNIPINIACEFGHIDVVKYILSKGVDINVTNSKGITPLITAVIAQNFNLIIFLLLNGATIDIQDINCRNSLYYAEKAGNIQIINLLNNWAVLMLLYLDYTSGSNLDSESIEMIGKNFI